MDLLSDNQITDLVKIHGAPVYLYSRDHFRQRGQELISINMPYGLTVRYAMKANPHKEIITLFDSLGLHFDASSGYEAEYLLDLGISGDKISVSAQEPPHNLEKLIHEKVELIATSLHQLQLFTDALPKQSKLGLRINPGIGSGHNRRVTTGGVGSSFGLWHEQLRGALEYAHRHKVSVNRLHIHVGSGADPAIWRSVIKEALVIAKQMPDVIYLDIGGGYKIARTDDEKEADMQQISQVFSEEIELFYWQHKRKLHLEIEPGTWLVGHGGILVAKIIDIVNTGKNGYKFLRLNTGMNDIMRPTLYGSQHQINIINKSKEYESYVVVGHNCETGDILSPAPADPETMLPRRLKRANIGDTIVIHDTGAYCANMSAHGYNGYPDAKEIFV